MESLRSRALAALIASQNPEGGWGYHGACSWTEPAALALLALRGEPGASECVSRGNRYLLSLQRPDGGWPPRETVERSTWVTALAVLALGPQLNGDALKRAVRWLLDQRAADTSFVHRLRMRMLGESAPRNQGEGWPWFPDTASWVAPTAVTIVALRKLQNRSPSPNLDSRLGEARQFLWSRACGDGGWNHGSTRALGYEAPSYPETTGLALTALRGDDSPRMPTAVAAAERHLRATRFSSAHSWLRLGLIAQGRPVSGISPQAPTWRGNMDAALCLLAERAESEDLLFGD